MGKKVGGALLGAVIGAGLAWATGGALLMVSGSYFAAGTVGRVFLTNAVLGFLAGALAPKPSSTSQLSGRTVASRNAVASRKIAYGQVKTSGTIVFLESTGDENKYLHQITTLAGHEISEVLEVYLGDDLEYSNLTEGTEVSATGSLGSYAKITGHFGSSTQTADSNLVSRTSWTNSHRLQGIAYLYTRFQYDQDKYPNGAPNVSAIIKGKAVYDPRSETTGYSNNAALCILDYLTNTTYGLGASTSEIDFASFITAANICDEDVTLDAGGTEKRYTINGLVDTNSTPSEILQQMASACAGTVYYSNGQWHLKAGAYITPTSTLTNDDFTGFIDIVTCVTNQSNFNAVKGVFISPEDSWQPVDFPPIISSTFESEDGGEQKYADMTMPFTTSSSMAQRLAKIALYRNREQLTVNVPCKLTAFKYDIGDTVMITNERMGWTNKVFEVIGWQFGTGEVSAVNLSLKETSTDVYGWATTDEQELTRNNTTLPSPFIVGTINNLTYTAGGDLQSDGTFIESAILNWDALGGNVQSYEVQWKLLDDIDWASTITTNNSIEIAPIRDGSTYIARIRGINSFNVRNDWVSIQFSGNGDTGAPLAPASLTANGQFGSIYLQWVNPANTDFNHVKIYESPDNDVNNAVVVATTAGSVFTRGNLPPSSTRYYWVAAVDNSGNEGEKSASAYAVTDFIASGDIADNAIGYEKFASDVTAILDEIDNKVDQTDFNVTIEYQQQLENAVEQLSIDALGLALNTGDLKSRMNDAGIVVNPDTGEVTISAVSVLEDTVNDISVDLNAVEGELLLKASTTYVNNAIAAAVLDAADLASLNELEARVDTAEIDINSIEGSITLTSTGSLYNVNDGVLGVEALEGRITIAEGEIDLKASTTQFNDINTRLNSAEIALDSIDAPSIALSVQEIDAQSAKIDNLANLTLQEALGRYQDRKYIKEDVASARFEITADVNDQREALAQAELVLQAAIDDNQALIAFEQTARANADSALASDITLLQADVADNSAQILSEQTARANADIALASDITALQASVSTNAAAIVTEATARANADSALTSTLTSLSTTVSGHTTTLNTYGTSISGIEAKYGVEIDNNGIITGYQLISGEGSASAFNVRADQFNIYSEDGESGALPFTVRTAEEVIGGITYPAGVYMTNAYVDAANVINLTTGNITTGTITSSSGNISIDLDNDTVVIKSGSEGARLEMTESTIRVYDANNVLRVKLGDLS